MAYKRTKRLTPARQCPKLLIYLEPGLMVRLGWLAEKNGTSKAAQVEQIVTASKEVQHAEAIRT